MEDIVRVFSEFVGLVLSRLLDALNVPAIFTIGILTWLTDHVVAYGKKKKAAWFRWATPDRRGFWLRFVPFGYMFLGYFLLFSPSYWTLNEAAERFYEVLINGGATIAAYELFKGWVIPWFKKKQESP